MLKDQIKKLANKLGYDFVKTPNFEYGRENKRKSSDDRFDYYETNIGNYFLPKECRGDVVANSIRTGRVFDLEILNVIKSFIHPNSIVLDIGANYGQMSIEISKMSSEITVYSFEAQKLVFDILEKNIECNNINNVKLFYNAVFDTNDLELFFPEPDLVRFASYGSYGIDIKSKKGIKVKSLTIDSINFERPVSFMKIDIQGSDLAALRGAVNTITKYKMPIIFEYEEQFQEEFGTTFQDYVDFVDQIGYKFLKTVQEINYLIVPK